MSRYLLGTPADQCHRVPLSSLQRIDGPSRRRAQAVGGHILGVSQSAGWRRKSSEDRAWRVNPVLAATSPGLGPHTRHFNAVLGKNGGARY